MGLANLFQKQKQASLLLRSEPIKNRLDRLNALRKWVINNRPALHRAMYADMHKAATEVDGIEILHVLSEIKHALQNLDTWSKPKKIDAPLELIGTRSYIQYEPRGVCLVISPWNYPFSLCIGPLVSAIAAGNCAILKPSELTPNVSREIRRMTEEVFDSSIVSTIEGDAATAEALLKFPFDHIFFTGSPSIGKIVMKAAAENLSSVTLELGGKSPTIVTAKASIKEAAKRIAVAKFVNSGQTCVAPDYILVHEEVATALSEELVKQTKSLFTEKGESFQSSQHYSRIINEKHMKRLQHLKDDAITKGAHVLLDGEQIEVSRFFHPTILTHVSPQSEIMESEIFGPILPVITFKTLDEVINMINQKPKPLALYIFTNNVEERRKILHSTSSGGACINECAIQFLNHNLPFGGVNNSGIGKSHGYYGFLAFSNEKSVLKQFKGISTVQLFYPPYTKTVQRVMNWFLKLF